MPREIKATPRREERLERGGFEVSSHHRSDGAIRSLTNSAKKRRYAANDETFFSSEETRSRGENVPLTLAEKATDQAETELEVDMRKAVKKPKAAKEQIETRQRPVPVKHGSSDPAERTDDPVRMYLRDMSTVKLLSREGEAAIAKRIEAGRETMLEDFARARSPSRPLTSGARSSTRGKVYLRDVVDLDVIQAGS